MHQASEYFCAFLLLLGFTTCTTATNAQLPPNEQEQLYKSIGVKEVRVEHEVFYQGKIAVSVYLHERLILDQNGRTIRRETAGGSPPKISNRQDTEFNEKGLQLFHIRFDRQNPPDNLDKEKSGAPESQIVWMPAERYRYPQENKKGGTDRWRADKQQWRESSTVHRYMKRDTLYTETKELDYDSRKTTRSYTLKNDKNITRTDYLTYSPKGLGEPRFYYSKIKNGRLVESGSVDFEEELYTHLEKHPEDRRRIFGAKSNFHNLHDQVARQNPGKLKPNETYSYNAAGQLTEKNSYGTKIIYKRDAAGKLLSEKEIHDDKSGHIITYYYNEKGLVTKALSTYLDGKPEENHFYEYRYH